MAPIYSYVNHEYGLTERARKCGLKPSRPLNFDIGTLLREHAAKSVSPDIGIGHIGHSLQVKVLLH